MGSKQPIFFFVYGHHYLGGGGTIPSVVDLDEYAGILSRYGVKGTFFFDGLLVEHLLQEDPAIFERLNAQDICLGYHGEETHGPYPVIVDYLYHGVTNQDNLVNALTWNEAVQTIEERYSHAIEHGPIDPLTHTYDIRQGGYSDLSRIGGIALVQQAFKRPVEIITTHGLEAAPAGYAFSKMSNFKVAEACPPLTAHYFSIIGKPGLEEVAMSLGGRDSIFLWYMNQLHTKEYREDEIMVFLDTSFEKARQNLLSLERQRPHLVSVLMLNGPGLSKTNFVDMIRYIATDFIPSDGVSRFVTPRDMLAMVEEQNEQPLTRAVLKELATEIVKQRQGRPPDWLQIHHGDFSLVNAFEGLALVLASYQKTGHLPEEVHNTDLLGPIGEPEEARPGVAGSIPTSDFLREIVRFSKNFYTDEPKRVPLSVVVAGHSLNTSELLLLMAHVYLAVSEGQVLTEYPLEPAEVTPPYADIFQTIFHPENIRPLWYSKLQLWTIKPARFRKL
jgi:hypothetical protein